MSQIIKCDRCKKERIPYSGTWVEVDVFGADMRTHNDYIDYPLHFCSAECITEFFKLRHNL